MKRLALLAALLGGCGGGWNDADTAATTAAVRAQQALRAQCEADGGAGCSPSMVRAVERATTCNLGSMLHRHGTDVVDRKGCGQ